MKGRADTSMASIRAIHEFMSEATSENLDAAALTERWRLLETACDLFLQHTSTGAVIAGSLPIASMTCMRNILPALGREVGADKVGFDLGSAPRTFLKMVGLRLQSRAGGVRIAGRVA